MLRCKEMMFLIWNQIMANAMMDAETLSQNLQQFCGTEQYYKHWLGFSYTD